MASRTDPPDLFTPEFKRLKSRHSRPDLRDVIDLTSEFVNNEMSAEQEGKYKIHSVNDASLPPVTGLLPPKQWKVVEFSEFPGLMIILNPFLPGYQRYWVARCLRDFPADKENVTNLSALGDQSGTHLWLDFVKTGKTSFTKQDPLRKLRWTTLGYHYNWTTKEYYEDQKAPFPLDMSCLTEYLAHCLGFDTFRAEASIVNFYHMDSTLAGHTDHSEVDLTAPLFSISFGQSAMFMVGGPKKSIKPMTLILRSGDICVMSGTSRLAYHAVPKILPAVTLQCSNPLSCFLLKASKVTECAQGNGDGFCVEGQDSSQKTHTTGSKEKGRHLQGDSSNVIATSECAAQSANVDKEEKQRIEQCVWEAKSKCSKVCEDEERLSCEDVTNVEAARRFNETSSDTTSVHLCAQDSSKSSETSESWTSDIDHSVYRHNIQDVNRKIQEEMEALDFSPFLTYLQTSRINVNTRQVVPFGSGPLRTKVVSEKT